MLSKNFGTRSKVLNHACMQVVAYIWWVYAKMKYTFPEINLVSIKLHREKLYNNTYTASYFLVQHV